ncbi:C-type lectin domain family 17, member A [Oryzias melastigma]|uniref:C-type lectin domain family 17, member A-like n=2 Tax=Oryzias melastigma TaxID=30732 RepID=A0A3B3DLE8_ORYME|nr:C-type lectin domain family 17, member A [Oryzias melastigma]
MEAVYGNVKSKNPVCQLPVSNPPASIKFNRRCYLSVIIFMVMLSVLLLAGLIVFSLFYGDSVRNLPEISDSKDNVTEHLNAVIERLNSRLTEATKKLMEFKQGKTGCPAEWIRFGSSCYFFSGESKFWDAARKFCRAREADLVVINSNDENTFVSALKKESVWIGLSDEASEGTWKWVDGSSLTLEFWRHGQPDNHDDRYGEENCGHIRNGFPGQWNDLTCYTSLQFICEKD